jgi:RNA polymerase sigma-70 factor (ECF subfamily)
MAFGERFEQVLAAAQAGGDWAWRDIYESLSPVVLGYLRGRGSRDPEDLTGEVFVQVVRRIHSFSGGEDAFRAWILTIARRRLIDEYRARGRRPDSETETAELEAIGPTGDVEREAIAGVEAAMVVRAIRELSSDQQDVLLLRVVGDLTLEQVAKVLGKSLTAVKALQRRGLAALSKKIPRETVSL